MPVSRREPFGDSPTVGERGANTHRKILDAALQVIGEHGYHDTQIEMITEKAGCSRPTFYQYFSGKDDVFWRLANDLATVLGDLSRQLNKVNADDEGLEILKRWFDGLIDVYEAYYPMFQVFTSAANETSKSADTSVGVGDRIGKRIVGQLNGVDKATADAITGFSLSVFLRLIHYWRTGFGDMPRARLVRGAACSIHRLRFGPISGVNALRPVAVAKRRARDFPSLPESPKRNGRSNNSRQQLLVAGRKVLAKKGYHETRIDDISKQAKLSHGAFYRHFKSKDEFLAEIGLDAIRSMSEVVAKFPQHGTSANLEQWLSDWYDSYWTNGGIVTALQEVNYVDPAVANFTADLANAMLDRMNMVVASRGYGDSLVDAMLLVAALERAPYATRIFGHLPKETSVRAIGRFIQIGLLAPLPNT